MSKIQILLFTLAFVAMAFTVGYKVGDAHGYNEGYDVGYRYDCKAEIANLYDQVKATKKAVSYTDKQLKSSLRERDSLQNVTDSLKHPQLYREYKNKYHEDTLKYGKIADRRNDSLRKIGHPAAGSISRTSGKLPILLCYAFKDNPAFLELPECAKYRK